MGKSRRLEQKEKTLRERVQEGNRTHELKREREMTRAERRGEEMEGGEEQERCYLN